MMRRLLTFTCSATLATAVWVYTWPYGASNSCKCVQQEIGSIISFENAEDCLSSFAAEDDEYCTYASAGLSQHKCASAVSIKQGMFNTDCQTMCNEMITGFISEEEFAESCKLELISSIGEALAPASGMNSCFANTVYGWADFDPHNNAQGTPTAVHNDVDSASACQELCQMTKTCVFFSWRGLCDSTDVGTAAGYQSSVGACLLYDKAYMDGVLAVDTSDPDALVVAGSGKYCNAEALGKSCSLSVISDGSHFFPFGGNRNCLLCGCQQKCAWNSNTHITGPKFCGDATQNSCNFPLSEVTTTSTAPNCPAATCPSNGQTTTARVVGSTTTGVELDSTTTGATTTGIELDTTTPAPTTTTPARVQATTTTKRHATCKQCLAECDDEVEDCDCDDYC